jgi:hypothetical protein
VCFFYYKKPLVSCASKTVTIPVNDKSSLVKTKL